MIKLPSTRPVRLAQQVCRVAGVAYLMIGAAVVTILLAAPNLGQTLTGGQTAFEIKDGVWTSSTFWWDGVLNPLFHGMVFFVLASALGYLADLGEALIERDAEAEYAAANPPAFAQPIEIGDDIPSLTQDDLQPLR